jgi:hypothetical protein
MRVKAQVNSLQHGKEACFHYYRFHGVAEVKGEYALRNTFAGRQM